MKRAWRMSLLIGWLIAGAVLTSRAQQQDVTYLDPEKAGPDYAIQGEYVGLLGSEQQRWGCQVIALGDGKFEAVGLRGGLPGDGWERGMDRVVIPGERVGEHEAVFRNDKVELRVRDGKMHVRYEGEDVGALEKVQRKSPTLGAAPPPGAIVLFDGTSAENFVRGRIVEGNLLAADCESKQKFGDHSLHIEFRTPFKPFARGQARGNSGVYVQGRYEIQVLDSFGLEGRNNECGAIYSIREPSVNMCFPPLTWQTYDIDFTAARYDDQGNKIKNARITVRHNGVVIIDDFEIPRGTPGKDPEGPGPGSLYLQGHGNPVVYRNIWVVPK
ncbi:MAG: hypothetical protein KatS3mg110_1548 [Pirellulaceae bacterium]|nr:MAG: hypothetical protein KatS3mg110_1548 [Pirellulaceae bacterium]